MHTMRTTLQFNSAINAPMTFRTNASLVLGAEYRSSRRITSLLCVVGLGWSTAQFEIGALNLTPVGAIVQVSSASIPYMLMLAILYMTIKSVIGFVMQSREVRRWRLAQLDFNLFLFLVRLTLVMLAAGGLHRSVDTFLIVVVGALILVIGSMLALFLGMFLLVPLIMAMRTAIGRPYNSASVAPYIAVASAWSEFIVVLLVSALLIALGFAGLKYDPILALWVERPDPIAMTVLVVTAVAVVNSYWLQSPAETKLFARSVPKLTKLDGKIGVTFPDREIPTDD